MVSVTNLPSDVQQRGWIRCSRDAVGRLDVGRLEDAVGRLDTLIQGSDKRTMGGGGNESNGQGNHDERGGGWQGMEGTKGSEKVEKDVR